ncbi:MAG: thioesterase [Bacteroidetes bacterium HGW-Bacteroidetes-1]|jgi:acyl-CoA thioester hydrolase|nr:MAG: thioesterase [Bacteroidetes bacterium HGW-Bacteroidetes-1]
MYFKEFEIRWSDLDPNRHVSNSAYINFMSHTRMSFLMENGLGHNELIKNNLGPVAFYEHMFYFKEVFVGKPIKVSLQLKGLSEDGMFFEFLHNFYDSMGQNFARCEMMGAWINLSSRKLTGLPDSLKKYLERLSRTKDFRVLTKEDTRKTARFPNDLL